MRHHAMAYYLFALASLLITSCGKYVTETGKASYYSDEYNGRETANGEVFYQAKLTAAHKTIPFGTEVSVKNLSNGKVVTVKINDRGPFVKGRIIDLSKKAAEKINMINDGVVQVQIKYRKKKNA
jgi:rare lipoprotein A